MALTPTEETLVRQLVGQQAAILSLAGNEATITSKLAATKVTLADLIAASLPADADLLLTRQGTTDKSVRADTLAAYMAASSTFTNKYLAVPTMELTSVPSQKIAPIICVTQPHLRVMVWSGSKYVRAPWHQPCQMFFSYDNPSSIQGALPVRADVSYQQSNYPDLVARLGLSGNGTFTLAEARGEFIRVLDNGRGVDAGRAVRSFQEGTSISQFIGRFSAPQIGAGHEFYDVDGVVSNKPTFSNHDVTTTQLAVGVDYLRVRPRNVAYPLWITY